MDLRRNLANAGPLIAQRKDRRRDEREDDDPAQDPQECARDRREC